MIWKPIKSIKNIVNLDVFNLRSGYGFIYNLTHGRPRLYLELYLLVIVLFSFLYFLSPPEWFSQYPGEEGAPFLGLGVIQAFYFSVVTITTLGYGDISPAFDKSWLQVAVAVQAILGIVIIGLFLGSISIFISDIKSEEFNSIRKQEEDNKNKVAMRVLRLILDDYINGVLSRQYVLTSLSKETIECEAKDIFDRDFFNQISLIDYSVNYYYGGGSIGDYIEEKNNDLKEKLTDYLRIYAIMIKEARVVEAVERLKNNRFLDYPSFYLAGSYKRIDDEGKCIHLISLEYDSENKSYNSIVDFFSYLKELLESIELSGCDSIVFHGKMFEFIQPLPGSAISPRAKLENHELVRY